MKPIAAWLAGAALAAIWTTAGLAQDVIFLSTQLRPVEEATKVRQVILKGVGPVTYAVEEPSPFQTRMDVIHGTKSG
mgnify:CR=1 FL=1